MSELFQKFLQLVDGDKMPGSLYCILCHRHVSKAEFSKEKLCICDSCRKEMNCYLPGSSIEGTKEIPFFLAAAPYQGRLRAAFQRYKFMDQWAYREIFTELMIRQLSEVTKELCPDLVVAVPLSEQRMRERGFNQVAELAHPFAEEVKISWSDRALFRIRHTKRQSSLPAALRIHNVKNAFLADATVVHGKRILLVDDILTRGATMDSCARALKKAGAAEVIGAVLFRTEPREWKFSFVRRFRD